MASTCHTSHVLPVTDNSTMKTCTNQIHLLWLHTYLWLNKSHPTHPALVETSRREEAVRRKCRKLHRLPSYRCRFSSFSWQSLVKRPPVLQLLAHLRLAKEVSIHSNFPLSSDYLFHGASSICSIHSPNKLFVSDGWLRFWDWAVADLVVLTMNRCCRAELAGARREGPGHGVLGHTARQPAGDGCRLLDLRCACACSRQQEGCARGGRRRLLLLQPRGCGARRSVLRRWRGRQGAKSRLELVCARLAVHGNANGNSTNLLIRCWTSSYIFPVFPGLYVWRYREMNKKSARSMLLLRNYDTPTIGTRMGGRTYSFHRASETNRVVERTTRLSVSSW